MDVATQGRNAASGEMKHGRNSFFDGGLLSYILNTIIGILITVCSFGILYPWAVCIAYGWKINHTVIEGKRMQFTGSAVGLFGNWIKWLLLSIITLGIYLFWVNLRIEDWKAKNTVFVN
ncbi:DUF898 family protein [Companilactobacillus ginsenosidimutans]|uniref:Membrane protein n=1 Tax=Companilactobacillus ginsenosidimutans TaxID=1007676 RepID=A0A0H4QKJ3_9LACO|nr:DUF898 family protein [Companilactobacillus ginsenosidimutans]AKP68432.1 membrane protein [Companilactobacillus ginsenosidimutans]